MVGEYERPTRLQSQRHLLEHGGESFGKVRQSSLHVLVPREFSRVSRGDLTKGSHLSSRKPPQPHVAEVHEFGILYVSEIRRVCKHSVQCVSRELSASRITAAKIDN